MTASIPYTVTGTLGNIGLRKYPELVLASVDDPGDDRGFLHLFRYITGSNRSKNRIAMTACEMHRLQIVLAAMPDRP